MKKIIKEMIIPLLIIWIALSGFNIYYVHDVMQNLDFGMPISREKPPVSLKPEIKDFGAKTFGEPCVGDTIEIFAKISNNNDEKMSVDILIKEKIDGREKEAHKRTISLKSHNTRMIKYNHILKNGGKHKFYLYYIIGGKEHLGESFSLEVRSYKENTKFIVTYFHFNVQFRCGDPLTEERIINGSIRNLLECYYEYPHFKFSFEIQSLAIEIMAEEYPDLLVMMRDLTERGQMELIVTHYSDQFFIAYPELDLRKSIEISDDILNRNKIRRSNVFGCQEWQWSPFLPEIMDDYDYNIFVGLDKTFRKYTDLSELDTEKYKDKCVWETKWNEESAYVVFNGNAEIDRTDEGNDKILFSKWAWHHDGELLNTKGYDNEFRFLEDEQKQFENKLKTYEDLDYEFITISEFVYTALEKDLGIHELGVIPCTPQRGKTFLWSGEKRHDYERDVYINTLRYKARTSLLALETMMDKADDHDIRISNEAIEIIEKHDIIVNNEDNVIIDLWKELLLAEVTDSTGWTPDKIEVDYSIEKATNIINACKEIVHLIIDKLDVESDILIDTDRNKISEDLQQPTYEELDSPLSFDLSHNNYSYNCYKYSENLYKLEITVNPAQNQNNAIIFDISRDNACYSPLGVKDYMNIGDFASDEVYFMLSNGWIYLGNDTSLIKVCTTRHVAMLFNRSVIEFRDEPTTETVTYHFFIFYGNEEDALNFANRLNVNPYVSSDDITSIVLTEKMIYD